MKEYSTLPKCLSLEPRLDGLMSYPGHSLALGILVLGRDVVVVFYSHCQLGSVINGFTVSVAKSDGQRKVFEFHGIQLNYPSRLTILHISCRYFLQCITLAFNKVIIYIRLFYKMRFLLKRKRIQTADKITESVAKQLIAIPKRTLHTFEEWKWRYDKCVRS